MAHDSIRERYIPIDKAELVERLSRSQLVPQDGREGFLRFSKILASTFHFEFHAHTEALTQSYRPFNPDLDTAGLRRFSDQDRQDHERHLMEAFEKILIQANYEQISAGDLAYAIDRESLFKINLFVDFDDFENQLVFGRGLQSHRVKRRKGYFKEETIRIDVYDRVALIIKYKAEAYFRDRDRKALNFDPGSMIVKLFKNIPRGDLEMLFPNAQVRMKLKDKLLMGGFAVGGGVAVALKAGAGLVAMASILWLMTRSMVASGGEIPTLGPVEISGMVGGMTALGAIGAFLFKQWNSYKNRKIKFMKALGDHLYFKNLDNNAGVFYHIIADAEEEEFKEALLAYLFLAASPSGLSAASLDEGIETWFAETYDLTIDFEIEDALGKLKRLDLCTIQAEDSGGLAVWTALPIMDACAVLGKHWDDFFSF